nr:alpha/beta hydrolase [Terrimicrobium sacchariphilum]
MKWEGEKTADALMQKGFDVVILEYHVLDNPDVAALPESGRMEKTRELALEDALKAYRLLRTRGPEWNLHMDRLAVMGYSAGGHLAARLAQHLTPAELPSDLVLIYPAYLDKPLRSGGGREVVPPEKTGRLYVLFGDQDNAGWIRGCQDYVADWERAGGKATVVFLPGLGHGFGASKIEALNDFFRP